MIKKIEENKIKYFIAILIFILLFITSLKLSMDFCPDERMRYDVPKFILNHGILPNGDEKEIV